MRGHQADRQAGQSAGRLASPAGCGLTQEVQQGHPRISKHAGKAGAAAPHRDGRAAAACGGVGRGRRLQRPSCKTSGTVQAAARQLQGRCCAPPAPVVAGHSQAGRLPQPALQRSKHHAQQLPAAAGGERNWQRGTGERGGGGAGRPFVRRDRCEGMVSADTPAVQASSHKASALHKYPGTAQAAARAG